VIIKIRAPKHSYRWPYTDFGPSVTGGCSPCYSCSALPATRILALCAGVPRWREDLGRKRNRRWQALPCRCGNANVLAEPPLANRLSRTHVQNLPTIAKEIADTISNANCPPRKYSTNLPLVGSALLKDYLQSAPPWLASNPPPDVMSAGRPWNPTKITVDGPLRVLRQRPACFWQWNVPLVSCRALHECTGILQSGF